MRYRLDDGTPAQPPTPINADTLQGHSAEYFATAAQFAQVAPYKAGDTIVLDAAMGFGYVTSATSAVRIFIPLGRVTSGLSGTIVSASVAFRGISGYLNGESGYIDLMNGDYTLSMSMQENGITLLITKNTPFTNTENNTPVIAYFSALTITFGEAT